MLCTSVRRRCVRDRTTAPEARRHKATAERWNSTPHARRYTPGAARALERYLNARCTRSCDACRRAPQTGVRALPLSLREKRRGARPVYRRDVSASSAPARTPCHALEYSLCARDHTRRDAVPWEQTSGPSASNKRRRVPGDVQAKIQPARGRREGMSGPTERREPLRYGRRRSCSTRASRSCATPACAAPAGPRNLQKKRSTP